jgi:hypothetical protein
MCLLFSNLVSTECVRVGSPGSARITPGRCCIDGVVSVDTRRPGSDGARGVHQFSMLRLGGVFVSLPPIECVI